MIISRLLSTSFTSSCFLGTNSRLIYLDSFISVFCLCPIMIYFSVLIKTFWANLHMSLIAIYKVFFTKWFQKYINFLLTIIQNKADVRMDFQSWTHNSVKSFKLLELQYQWLDSVLCRPISMNFPFKRQSWW